MTPVGHNKSINWVHFCWEDIHTRGGVLAFLE